MITSNPPYLTEHSGAVIVVGSSAGVLEEYENVRACRAHAKVAALNYMGRFIASDFIITAHENQLGRMSRTHRERWGTMPELHGVQAQGCPGREWTTPRYSWSGLVLWRGGTSSCVAAILLGAMGFDEILLVGCPLDKVGVIEGYPHINPTSSAAKVWEPSHGLNGVIDGWRARWRQAKREGLLENVRSASGYTKELCGGIG